MTRRWNGKLGSTASWSSIKGSSSVSNAPWDDPALSRSARRRIENLLVAREAHREQVSALVEPFRLIARGPDVDVTGSGRIANKLPKNHGILSYQANVFRDWNWNNGENEAQLRALEAVLRNDSRDRLGKVLTLGAGACRLAYDLHRNHYVDLSVVTDINPLLLSLASQVVHGASVPLVEFPIAPLNEDAFAVHRNCRAPQSIDAFSEGEFEFLFADAMNPPFEAGSFDTVLTPWLIDIIPQNMREFIPRINQLLPTGGIWLNTGSLAFFNEDESWNYSEDELLSLVQDSGFELLAADRTTIPYLKSPASSHGRTECVLSFSARKVCNVPVPPRFSYMPDWVHDSTLPIPSESRYSLAASHRLLQAQVLGAVDGRRSIQEISQLLAHQYGLEAEDVAVAVKFMLVEAYEGGLTASSTDLP